MGKETGISWTDHTFNFVRGCVHATTEDGVLSRACLAPCYAEVLSGRNPRTLGTWGPHGNRVFGGDSYWKQLADWNRDAPKDFPDHYAKVFCCSLSDLFEGRCELCDDCRSATVPGRCRPGRGCGGIGWREHRDGVRADYLPHLHRLRTTFETSLYLRGQWLTKRPWNAARYAREFGWPWNAWAGITAEGQRELVDRERWLRQIPATIRFLSIEPVFGHLDLRPCLWDTCRTCRGAQVVGRAGEACACARYGRRPGFERTNAIQWVILGGNSAHDSEMLDLDHVRELRDQCQAAGVSVFVKQMGWAWARANRSGTKAGTDPAEFPVDLQVQDFPVDPSRPPPTEAVTPPGGQASLFGG